MASIAAWLYGLETGAPISVSAPVTTAVIIDSMGPLHRDLCLQVEVSGAVTKGPAMMPGPSQFHLFVHAHTSHPDTRRFGAALSLTLAEQRIFVMVPSQARASMDFCPASSWSTM